MTRGTDLLAERHGHAQDLPASFLQILQFLWPQRSWPDDISPSGLLQLCARNPDNCPQIAALHLFFCKLLRAPDETVQDRAEAVDRLLAERLAFAADERMVVVSLDGSGRVLRSDELARGGIDRCTLPLRALVEVLITSGARRFILAHNHPSGDARPSDEDRRLSQLVAQKLEGLGLTLVDHLVIARSGYASALHGGPVFQRSWLKLSA